MTEKAQFVDLAKRVVKLFEPGETNETSGLFIFERQATIEATNLGPEDHIEFEVIHINGGEWPSYDQCCKYPGEPPTIDSYSTLTCADCEASGNKRPIKLTSLNPVVVLNAPQHTLLRARYVGENVQLINVWAVLETESTETDMFNGCHEDCDPVFKRTGNIKCNPDDDTMQYEIVDQFGNIDFEDPVPLAWEATGRIRFADESNPSWESVEAEYIDPCGNIKWEITQFLWQPTSDYTCKDLDETSAKYSIVRRYVNENDASLWIKDEEKPWMDTGNVRCQDNLVYKQQITTCGDVRWFQTDETCGYLATYRLDSGGLAYRPGQQDPEATVALEDCDGNVIAYIYPEPREGAKTPVTTGCTTCAEGGEVLGYAVDSTAPVINMPKQSLSRVVSGGLDYLPGLVIKQIPDLVIKNLEQKVFDGVIKALPTVEAEIKNKISISVDSLPVMAVSTFEKDGEVYALFSDGTYKKLTMPEAKQANIVYMLNGMSLAGNAPKDETSYTVGDLVTLAQWPNLLPEGLRLEGWSLSPEGKNIMKAGSNFNIDKTSYLYAIWGVALKFVDADGFDTEWHKVGETVRLPVRVPTKEGYTFDGWQVNGGGKLKPGSEVTMDKPLVIRAVWKAN